MDELEINNINPLENILEMMIEEGITNFDFFIKLRDIRFNIEIKKGDVKPKHYEGDGEINDNLIKIGEKKYPCSRGIDGSIIIDLKKYRKNDKRGEKWYGYDGKNDGGNYG